MSQVKRLKAMGVEFEDPMIWKLLEELDNLPEHLAKKEREYQERQEFIEKVFGKAARQAIARLKAEGQY